MNKKFFNLCLVGTLFVGLAGSAVSCKDYDDDIALLNDKVEALEATVNKLQSAIDAGAVITAVDPTADGIKVTLSNGKSYDITNGKDGAKGDKGDQGIQGVQGEKGAQGDKGDKGDAGQPGKGGSVITIGENGNWFIDGVDTGKPSKGDKGDQGEQGVAGPQGPKGDRGEKGETGAKGDKGDTIYYEPDVENNVWVRYVNGDKDETYVGGQVYVPGTLTAVWDPETNSVKIAGVKNADGTVHEVITIGTFVIRSIVYRQMFADPKDAITITNIIDADKTFATVYADAEFRTSPATFDIEKAEFALVDLHPTKAADPAFEIVGTPVPTDEGNIKVTINAVNVKPGTKYAVALQITLNGQETTSEYFYVAAKDMPLTDIKNAEIKEGAKALTEEYTDKYATIVNDATLDLSKFAAATVDDKGVVKAYTDYESTTVLTLATADELEELEVEDADQDFFTIEEGVLDVKPELEKVSVGKKAVVKVTTTVVSNNIKDAEVEFASKTIVNYVAVTVVPTEKVYDITLHAAEGASLTDIPYNLDNKQAVALDVNDLLAQLGDANNTKKLAQGLLYAAYPENYYDKAFNLYKGDKTKGYVYYYEQYAPKNMYADHYFDPENIDGVERSAFVVFCAADGTVYTEDAMFLVLSNKALLKGEYLVGLDKGDANALAANPATDVIETIGQLKYRIKIDATVKRDASVLLKDQYSAKKVLGECKMGTDNIRTWFYTPADFDKMFECTPAGDEFEFVIRVDEEKNAGYKDYLGNQLNFTNNILTLHPKVDICDLEPLEVEVHDLITDEYHPFDWTFVNPVKSIVGAKNLSGNVSVRKMDTGDSFALASYCPEIANVVMTDICEPTAHTIFKAGQVSPVYYHASVKYSFVGDHADWDIDKATGKLTWVGGPSQTEYHYNVVVKATVSCDWHEESFTIKVSLNREINL